MNEKRSTKEAVLLLLQEASGNCLSGEEIAKKLGVSRQAVWKSIRELTEEEVPVEAQKRLGYRLPTSFEQFSAEDIRLRLSEDAAAFFRIETARSVTSTNTLLKERGSNGEAEGAVLLAEEQTAGRGRLGRSFYSPKGGGLYMSLLLCPPYPASESILITTLAAVSASRAVEALIKAFPDAEANGEEVLIKWVNDLFLNGRKICGILTEAALDIESGKISYAVLGLGFDLAPPEGGFPEELQGIAGSIFKKSCPKGARAFLAAAFLNDFLPAYRRLQERAYLPEYKKRQLLLQQAVDVLEADGSSSEATVLDVDENCGLIVRMEKDGVLRSLNSGEVRVRAKQF